jgi:hypothetical protein
LLLIQQEQVRRQQEQQVLTQQLEQKTLQHRIFSEKQKAQALELEKILNPQAFLPEPIIAKKEPAFGSDLPPNLQFLAKVLGPEAFEESKRKALALAASHKKDGSSSLKKEEQSKSVQSNFRSSLDRNSEYKDRSSEHKDKSGHKKHSSEGTALTDKQKHFRTLVAEEIVKIVGKYRKKGELANKEAFKNQCRTFTLKVVEGEIKNNGDLSITEKIITRMNNMVDKFFLKHGVANKKT